MIIVLFGALIAAAAFAVQPAEAATFHFLGGINDNYAPPTSPANPSASLQTWLGSSSYSPYDSLTINQRFADTFDNCPMCITGAELEIGLKPLSTATNDTIRFAFTDNFGNQTGPYWIKNIGFPAAQQSVLPLDWTPTNYPNGTILSLDLAALPLGNTNTNGSTPNLIPTLRQLKFLNVDIQDDTAVDYIDFKITTALAGDIDGDGCVDVDDFNLLVTNFNNSVPTGLGDPNGDGFYDINDLALVQADFGKCCPEPTSAVLMALGACGLGGVLLRRRWCCRKAFGFAVSAVIVLASNSALLATTVSFQQGIAGYSLAEDTFLSNANPNTNFGSLADLGVSGPGTNNEIQSLLAFYGIFGGGAGQIPLNATINSATLGVFNSAVSAGASGAIHRMLVPWSENVATWNSLTGGINNVPAGEIVVASSFSGPIGGGPFSVTSIVQAWSNGATNYGLAFVPNGSPTGGIVFRSSEHSSTTQHPILTVDYSVPEPMTVGLLFSACATLLLTRGQRGRPHTNW